MEQRSTQTHGDLVSFYDWIQALGITRITGWRWRKQGLITTVNIFGKLYISRHEIAAFEERAKNGEFHQEKVTDAAQKAREAKRAKRDLIPFPSPARLQEAA